MTRIKKIIKKKLKEPDEFITFTERTYFFIAHHSKSIAVGGGHCFDPPVIFLFLSKMGEEK